MWTKQKTLFIFFTSAIGLLFLNFLIISILSKSVTFGFDQMNKLRYFIIPISIGFGLQVVFAGLLKHKSKALVTGTTTINTTTMAACCAHHVSELIPFIALGGISTFLIQYQKVFLILSIILNWSIAIYFAIKLRKSYA